MKSIHVIACLGALLSAGSSVAEQLEAGCPIQGELVQWIADYCMLTLETDDEIIASDCIAKQLEIAAKDRCKAKRHYKSAMCKRVITREGAGSVEQCVADPGFAGSTVRNEGVGARQQVPAEGPRHAGSARR